MNYGLSRKSILLTLISAIFLSMSISLSASVSSFNPIRFHKDSLPNGLIVIYHIDKTAPVVSTIMHYKVGSKDENPSMTGFAHFFEHLMFESTDKIQRGELDRLIQNAGGNLNAHTSFDETVYYINLPANQLPLALWIESQRLRKLNVDTIGVETQRGVIQEERKQRTENQPYGDMLDRMMATLFKDGSYSWTPIGAEEHIAKATIGQFRDFYNNFYQPNNATLVISGDFDITLAQKYVDSYFAGIEPVSLPKREVFNMPPLEGEIRHEVSDKLAQMPAIFIGYRGPALVDSLYYPISLLSEILSSGESSRLYKRLVDTEQEAVAANFNMIPLEKAGVMLFVGVPGQSKSIKKVESLFYEELDKIVKQGISDDELEKAKAIFEAGFVCSKKSASNKARELASFQSYYNDPGLINSELEKYMSVTKEDIMKAAQVYLNTNNKVVLIYKPESQK
ncbi:MAG: insulinase family protein [Candidatus Kapabacteria bacterium]|nr:insulinase family protein [Ignavibacteriota bacterium]MCW5885455.1 insulinase family protein [Candidatus Kapabacteria bacterium]